MNLQWHRNARITPAIRQELQAYPPSVSNRESAETYHPLEEGVAKVAQTSPPAFFDAGEDTCATSQNPYATAMPPLPKVITEQGREQCRSE